MLLRLLIIGGAAALLTAFAGYHRLAGAILVVVVIAAVSLWGYLHTQGSRTNQLFAAGQVQITNLGLAPVNYRPNLFVLTGRLHNHSAQTTLDGVTFKLQMRDCRDKDDCRQLPDRREDFAVNVPPGASTPFENKLYFEADMIPKGQIKLAAHILSLRGHRPLWQPSQGQAATDQRQVTGN